MSTAVLTPTRRIPGWARPRFTHQVRSELIKLLSLRSIVVALAGIVASGVGISLALAVTMESAGIPSEPSASFVLWTVTSGVTTLGQLIAALVGVLAMTGEYSAGTIRSSLMSSPNRLAMLGAKALAVLGLVTAAGATATFGSWAATYPMFDALGIAVALTEPGMLVTLAGAALYPGLVAVFAVGIGAALRSAAGGISVTVVVLLLLPIGVSMLGGSVQWITDASPYLLFEAGESMSTLAVDPVPGYEPVAPVPLGQTVGGLVVLAWSAVSLAIGGALLRGRDV